MNWKYIGENVLFSSNDIKKVKISFKIKFILEFFLFAGNINYNTFLIGFLSILFSENIFVVRNIIIFTIENSILIVFVILTKFYSFHILALFYLCKHIMSI